MSSFNKDKFTFSFPIWMCFIFFVFPYCTDKNLKNNAERNDETKHSCFVSDHRRKAFGLSPLHMMSVLYQFEKMIFNSLLSMSVYQEWLFNLSNVFFLYLLAWSYINHLKQTRKQAKLTTEIVAFPTTKDQCQWFPVGITWHTIQSTRNSNTKDWKCSRKTISGQTGISWIII